ncbi:hypothetical protein OG323_06165 [Streptomyces cyaneofuscatus]|uniref:hypothetical protein n=1 Tax=Streptomyces cyaneofuscatus TaxID=66883 RepID=UPI0038702EFF|nr:hypothetical protein OG323_06165 [Streptomyces cyaneofuscatus]
MVVDHMTTHCPGTDFGDWEIGQNPTNGTIGVVWRVGTSRNGQAGVRGMVLYRWLNSLKDAGFVVEARTDMTVFGRPDEHAQTAWWLSVNGWDPAAVRHRAPVQRAARPRPIPSVTVPLTTRPADLWNAFLGEFPESITFEYKPTGLVVIASYPSTSQWIPRPAPWLTDLAETHRPTTA